MNDHFTFSIRSVFKIYYFDMSYDHSGFVLSFPWKYSIRYFSGCPKFQTNPSIGSTCSSGAYSQITQVTSQVLSWYMWLLVHVLGVRDQALSNFPFAGSMRMYSLAPSTV